MVAIVNTPVMLQRLAALLMLLAITFSSAETVMGLLRDGAVHHESNATAAVHAVADHGDHGHEDAAQVGAEHEHGPEHEHGTPSDHCTHQHGTVTAVRPPAISFDDSASPQVFLDPALLRDRCNEPSFRPPQA